MGSDYNRVRAKVYFLTPEEGAAATPSHHSILGKSLTLCLRTSASVTQRKDSRYALSCV
jgi:hypothetical protein